MKNIFLVKFILPLCTVGMLFFNSCKKLDEMTYDDSYTGIYFQSDSVYFSFGVIPLEVQSYDVPVPVKIMGSPATVDRTFSAEIIPEHTTAVAGEQYTILDDFVVKKDSVNSYIPVRINRAKLGTNNYKIQYRLVEKNGFVPVNENFKTAIVFFNNNVDKPTWKNSRTGREYWPTQLGVWKPITYIKFIELFRLMEQKAPETYAVMVEKYGKDLARLEAWPFDYNASMIKYVLIPLYQYFMEQNPQLGVVVPRPSGY